MAEEYDPHPSRALVVREDTEGIRNTIKYDNIENSWAEPFIRKFIFKKNLGWNLESILKKREAIMDTIRDCESQFDRKIIDLPYKLGTFRGNGISADPATLDEARELLKHGLRYPSGMEFPFEARDRIFIGSVKYFHASYGYSGTRRLVGVTIIPTGFTAKDIGEYKALSEAIGNLK